MKLLLGFFFLISQTPIFAESAESSAAIRKEIADNLDALVGDTIDEGSWDANIIRDEKENPKEMKCATKKHPWGKTYTCDITFLLTPYDSEEIEAEPWKATCTEVKYIVSTKRGKIILERDEPSVRSCLETLSESP